METPQSILSFWLDDVRSEGWYKADDAVDAEITARFHSTWEAAAAGQLNHWCCGPERALALLILTDQFSRNMFRGQGRAFATDRLARSVALRAVTYNWDQRVGELERQFFFVPMMHSEFLPDQERSMRWFMLRRRDDDNLLHPRAHRQVIREFSRFPYHNAALGRGTTDNEHAYLDAGGYGHTVTLLQGG